MSPGGLLVTAELLTVSLEALKRHKLRTALSSLGVVLGVAAVVSMVSITAGAKQETLDQVSALGLDNLVIRARPANGRAPSVPTGLTLHDAERLRQLVPGVRRQAAVVSRYELVAESRSSQPVLVRGVESNYFDILKLQTASGRLFRTHDERTLARVCVLGPLLARRLFGTVAPVGQRVQVGSLALTVVGVLIARPSDTRSAPSADNTRLDEIVLVPLDTLIGHDAELVRWQRIDELWLGLDDGQPSQAIATVAEQILSRTRPPGLVDFEVVVPRELLQQRLRLRRAFNAVAGSIAGIALVIGGIGIMNIMLAAVLERTTEIGLRRTVGARRRDIAWQFLIESTAMAVGGGMVGAFLGIGAALVISMLAGWPVSLSLWSIAAAGGVSIIVGVISGSYPAIKAAQLQPIDAVRYE